MERPFLTRLTLRLILLTTLATCTSCLESKNPVTEAKQGGRDEALCGAWKHREKDGTLWLLQFGYLDGAFKSPWMGCTFATTNRTEHTSTFLPCFVSRVAGVNYLNFANDIDLTQNQLTEDATLLAKIQQFSILKYELKDGTLILTTADESFLKQAIAAGTIRGENATVAASSAELSSFLEKNHGQTFPAKNAASFSKL